MIFSKRTTDYNRTYAKTASHLVAGSLRVTEAGASRKFDAGSLLFARKNFLAKFTKQPASTGPFRAITILFGFPLLHECSQ